MQGLLNLLLVLSTNSLGNLLLADGVAHVVGVVLEVVLCIHLLLESLIICLVLLCLLDHALNVILGEAALVVGDGDLVLGSSALILSRHVQDTVSVDIKDDANLGHTTGGGGNARQLKLAQQVVVLGAGALTLVHLNEHTRLVVAVGGEDLLLLGGDGGVAVDHAGEHTTQGLDTDGQGGHIQQQDVLHITSQHTTLDGSTHGYHLIWVHTP
mmetsp:Transcript_29784/g.77189  ORF Transcript_29784/g.77189 Transcript_29784/m.77189 type:complete len:212 (-) Transcript_29784:1307-1942(-)